MIIENQNIYAKKKIKSCIRRPHRWRRPIRCPCVLIWNNQPLPLKKIKYDVAINGGLANVTLSQEYFNNNHMPINVDYKFPINEDVVFGGIEAIFRNRKVKGQIKEKNQAKTEFLLNQAVGNTVAYAEQLEETEDVMKVQLGNFPPGEPLTIVFKYLARLDVFNDVNWGFRIPATLTPRYNPTYKHNEAQNVKTVGKYSVQGRYSWEVNVQICWPGGAKNVVCLSHQNQVVVSKNPGIIKVNFNPGAGPIYPVKDFELMIQDSNLFANNCQVAMCDLPTVTGGSPKYAAMFQFVPSLYKWYADKGINLEEGVDLYADDNNDFLMENTVAEYIFVIDRSGSMRGERIKKAKSALVFFLKSLPYNSKFNVISFGNNYQNMFPAAVEYSDQNLAIAISKINKFRANLGGTNILSPLQNAFSSFKTANYQRNIFLLTDGAVSNTNQVFTTIEANCVYNQSRVFSIGIGNGCSELLVKRSAKLGNGRSVIIADNDNVEGKIINLLNDSFTPSLTNFKVEFDQKYICAMAPMPNQHSHITRGEPFTMYALIKNDIEQAPNMSTQVSVSFYDSVEKKIEKRVFNVSLNGCVVSNAFHKMCVKQLLQCQKRVINTSYLDPVLAKAPSIATKLAVAYQVLSADHTAFICVIHKNVNGAFMPTQNVVVPTLESVDYNNDPYASNNFSAGMYGAPRSGIRKMKKASHAVNFGMKMKKSMSSRGRGSRGGGNISSNLHTMKKKSMKMSAPVHGLKRRAKAPAMKKKKRSMKVKEKKNTLQRESLERGKMMLEMEYSDGDMDISATTSSTLSNSLTNELVLKQGIRGGWKFDQATLNKIGVNQIRLNQISSKIQNQDCLMTIIILAWLLKNADQATTGIIVNKGMGYLRRNKLENYKIFVEEAKTFF